LNLSGGCSAVLFVLLQSSLAASRVNRTTFIVAHRLSTIADADLIVVLREGTLAEMGSHSELLSTGGLYAELWQKQAHQGTVDGLGSSSKPGSMASLQELDQQQQSAAGGPQQNSRGSKGAAGAVPHHHHHHH
jgi:ABC-type multidrug transport system ATPase subunit